MALRFRRSNWHPPIIAGALVVSCACYRALGATGPDLKSLSFSPASIRTDVNTGLTVSFTASDSSGVAYMEITFRAPSGSFRQSASTRLSGVPLATGSVNVAFPRFATAGMWVIEKLVLAANDGNTSIVDTETLHERGFATEIDVISPSDTFSPKLTELDFEPKSVDTTRHPAAVALRYRATDDLSGCAYLEAAFTSPSGSTIRAHSASITPTTNAAGVLAIDFPPQSEPGLWTLSSVFVSDAAGNALILDHDSLRSLRFPTSLRVNSRPDEMGPKLTTLSLESDSIDTREDGAVVTLRAAATDDVSGVKSIQAVMESPSGSVQVHGSVTLEPETNVIANIEIRFPKTSEAGRWTLNSVTLTDAAGNITSLKVDELRQLGVPTSLLSK